MARKINLKGLFETGKLSVSFDLGGENTSSSDGLGAMFDIDPNLTTKLKGDSSGNFGLFGMNLSFNPPIQGNSFRVKTIMRGLNSGSQQARIQPPGLVPQLIRDGVEDDAPNQKLQHNYDFKNGGLPSLGFDGITPRGSLYDLEIFNFEIFVTEEADPYEFNDSVLTTHAWNSSRYDGKQLSSAKINEYTAGDTTFAHTPVVSNYSRNIYIGSRVIGMREVGADLLNDDESLTPFPGFSYITVDDYITVNSDDSITRRSIRGGRGAGDDLTAKKGFYQAWYQDFPIGTKVAIKPLDKKLHQSLQQRYDIYNNSGQLQKALLVTRAGAAANHDSGSYYAASYTTASNIFDYCSGSGNPHGEGDIGAEYSIYNQTLFINDFFTGSLIASRDAGGVVDQSDTLVA